MEHTGDRAAAGIAHNIMILKLSRLPQKSAESSRKKLGKKESKDRGNDYRN